MAEMRGVAGGAAFRFAEVRVGQVFFRAPGLVHCDFGTKEDEDELIRLRRERHETIQPDDLLGGGGRFTIWDDDRACHVEIYGSVRHLAPLLREVADAFAARLAELPE